MKVSNSLCSRESQCLPCLSQPTASCARDTPGRACDRHLRLTYVTQHCVQVLGTTRLDQDVCFSRKWKSRDSKQPQRLLSSKLVTPMGREEPSAPHAARRTGYRTPVPKNRDILPQKLRIGITAEPGGNCPGTLPQLLCRHSPMGTEGRD